MPPSPSTRASAPTETVREAPFPFAAFAGGAAFFAGALTLLLLMDLALPPERLGARVERPERPDDAAVVGSELLPAGREGRRVRGLHRPETAVAAPCVRGAERP